jgi:hypothetical protein
MFRIGQLKLSNEALAGALLVLLNTGFLLPTIAAPSQSQQAGHASLESAGQASGQGSGQPSGQAPEQSAPIGQSITPSPTTESGQVFPATSHEQALYNARKGAGRSNPLSPITGFKPFPSNVEVQAKAVESIEKPGLPQTRFNELGGRTILPPPPPVLGQSDFPVSELPLPPDRPSIAAKLKLTGVIGDKAVFAITDREAIRVNKWPEVVMMAPGDRFESIQTVSVDADSAILEEDGERSTKTLERIR